IGCARMFCFWHRPSPCSPPFTYTTLFRSVVPPDGACTLTDSTVKGDVRVQDNAYFQATNTDIEESVKGEHALTIFIDTGSTVGETDEASEDLQLLGYHISIPGHEEDSATE